MLKSSLCAGLDSLLWQSQLYADSWLHGSACRRGFPSVSGIWNDIVSSQWESHQRTFVSHPLQ